MKSSDDTTLKEISNKLDVLIKLSAINLVKDTKTQREQIALLSDSGFQPKQIANILGTTNNVVSVTLTSIKKKKGDHETKEESSNMGANTNE
ncbi:MAG: hypothetical protein WD717_06535 [Nitrosarchaeum sp.]